MINTSSPPFLQEFLLAVAYGIEVGLEWRWQPCLRQLVVEELCEHGRALLSWLLSNEGKLRARSVTSMMMWRVWGTVQHLAGLLVEVRR